MAFRSSSERLPVLRYMMFALDGDTSGWFVGSCDMAEEAWAWSGRLDMSIKAVIDIETGEVLPRPTPPLPILESDDAFRKRLIGEAGNLTVQRLQIASGAELDDIARRFFLPGHGRRTMERD